MVLHINNTQYITYSTVDYVACPDRETSKASNTCNEAYNGYLLVPCSICKFLVVWISNLLKEDEANGTEDIHSSYYDRGTSDDGTATVECVCILERTYEDCHLSNEA